MKRHDNSDIKRENRRAIRIFIPILLASAVFGGCAGVLTVWLHDNPEMTASFLFWTNRILLACAPYTILVLTVLLMAVPTCSMDGQSIVSTSGTVRMKP